MYVLEETVIQNGVSEPVNFLQYMDYPGAMGAFNSYIKQSDDHWIILYTPHNAEFAIAIK